MVGMGQGTYFLGFNELFPSKTGLCVFKDVMDDFPGRNMLDNII